MDGTYLLVEYAIPLVDISDVALVFVEAFSGEFAFLINTKG